MNRNDFYNSVNAYIQSDLVRAYSTVEDPPGFDILVVVSPEKKIEQLIRVILIEDPDKELLDVIALSPVAKAPRDVTMLYKLFEENADGYYSRLTVRNDMLVQFYRYAIAELETIEMVKAFQEVARHAAYYLRTYFPSAPALPDA